jgi:Flp pilus assembly pilin Flp
MEEMKMKKIMNFFKDESGAGMIEYALLVALIGVALITVISTVLTPAINTQFTNAAGHITSAK